MTLLFLCYIWHRQWLGTSYAAPSDVIFSYTEEVVVISKEGGELAILIGDIRYPSLPSLGTVSCFTFHVLADLKISREWRWLDDLPACQVFGERRRLFWTAPPTQAGWVRSIHLAVKGMYARLGKLQAAGGPTFPPPWFLASLLVLPGGGMGGMRCKTEKLPRISLAVDHKQ